MERRRQDSDPSGDIDLRKLDEVPFGVILVDEGGTILYYNSGEEKLARRVRDDVIGLNFFTEVAPCTQVREFYDTFKRTVRETGLIAAFRFHYNFPNRPRDVQILIASFRYAGQILGVIIAGDLSGG